MIEICIDGFRVEARGHAGYDARGRDIVCAGVSALLYTAAQMLLELRQPGPDMDVSVRLHPGDVLLEAVPTEATISRCSFVFEMLETGLAMIARNYPNNVVIASGARFDKDSPTWTGS